MRASVTGSNLHIEFTLREKIFALKGGLTIPLDHIVAVSPGRPARQWSFRAPGTYFPGLIKAGTYYTRDGREFWYVRRGEGYKTYTIELRDEPYRRLVLSLTEIPNELNTLREFA